MVRFYVQALLEVRQYWPQLCGVLFLGALSAPIALLTPLPVKIIVDNVLGTEPLPWFVELVLPPEVAASSEAMLLAALALSVLIALLVGIHNFSEWQLRENVTERMQLDLRGKMFIQGLHSTALICGTKDRRDAGYRISHDAQCLQWTIIYGIIPVIISILSICGMLCVTALMSVKVALVALATSIPLVLLAYFSQHYLRDQWHQVKQAESDAFSIVQEALGGICVVNAFSQQKCELKRFIARSADMIRTRIRVVRIQGAIGLVLGCATTIGTALILYLSVRDAQAQVITVGEFIMIIAYVGQLYGPLQTIGSQVVYQQSAIASAERAFGMLDEKHCIVERPDPTPLSHTHGHVSFRNVSFAYPGRAPTLVDMSLNVPAGSYVGIIGETGAGKTTLINLLIRFFDPSKGHILLDGIDLRDYGLQNLRNQFAVVFQESILFSATIAENIAYGKPRARMDAIIDAAKKAHIHEFIQSLPEGYQTKIGDYGMRLSGGERQRLSLARAFLKDAPILILDEPTSAIDLRIELAIVESIEKFAHSRTTFLITHRPSMLNNADIVLKIEGGRIVPKTPVHHG